MTDSTHLATASALAATLAALLLSSLGPRTLPFGAFGEATRADKRDDRSLEPVELRFGWPDEGRVVVEKLQETRREKIDQTYALRWEREGDELVFAVEDYSIRRLNGRDASKPEVERDTVILRVLQHLTPPWHISSDGSFVGLAEFDYEAAIAAVPEPLRELARENEFTQDFLDVMYESLPTEESAVKTRALLREEWDFLCGMWAGLDSGKASTTTGTREASFMKVDVEAEFEYRLLERKEHRGVDCVVVEYSEHVASGQVDEEFVEDMERRSTLVATLEVETLRPHVVRLQRRVQLDSDGTKLTTDLDNRLYVFGWEDIEPPLEEDYED